MKIFWQFCHVRGIVHQIVSVSYPLILRQLKRLCDLMQELGRQHSVKRHEDPTSQEQKVLFSLEDRSASVTLKP